jgi:hypothetical protein
MKKRINLIFLLMIFVMSPFISAEISHVISNSENWQDVYSTMHYANLENLENDFLTSVNHGKILLAGISKSKEILVVTSRNNPYVFNYPDLIISEGFQGAQEMEVREATTELIEELPEIKNFIIIDDSYGYNAVAVAPYALLTDSWVFLVNRLNVQRVDSILQDREIENILVYGYMDRDLREVFEKYDPETINTGDKFKDNIEIVEKFQGVKESKQVLLTNGEFIEKEIMGGLQPILFTGRENVPDQIRDYLKNSKIEIGVLIGNELMSAATNIRRSTGISVMVKFARGARVAGQSVSSVEGLDLYSVPAPYLILSIEGVKYNRLTNQLELTYKSEANVPMYFRGTVTINANGETTRVGDSEPVFIAPGSYKTAIYSLELNSVEDLTAKIYTLFGETKTSLDRVLEEDRNIESIDILDRCEIDVKKVQYNKQSKEFLVEIKNIAEVDCWVSAEIEDLETFYEVLTIGSEYPIKISKKSSRKISISYEMDQEDLDKNSFVKVVSNYGERESSLIKVYSGRFELEIRALTTLTYMIIIIVLVLIFLFFLYRKAKKDEDEGY